jgi:hypothetical protein
MSEADAAPPPKRSRGGFLTAPFRRLSLPGRAGCALFLFLLLLVLVAWTFYFLNPIHVPWRHAMSWSRMGIVLALVVVTPLTLYWALRCWLIRYQSRFPDIDRAWDAGMQALRNNGISFRTTPVFVVLGSPSPEMERSLMDASHREFLVRGVPEGPAPLHWYANDEGIYLVCSEIGWISRLNRVVHQQTVKEESSLDSLTARP